MIRAKSRADFICKIEIVLEQADESHYWLEIIRAADLKKGEDIDRLIMEANELTAIFAATDKRTKLNRSKSDIKKSQNQQSIMYLQRRNRILRQSPAIRAMVAETALTPNDFIVPLFIDEGQNIRTEIASMPGYYRSSLDITIKEVKELWGMGIKSVLLFIKCRDEWKDNTGREAWNPDGLMQRSIKAIKDAVPEILVMTDVALDPYSSYGHDGIVKDEEIVNDETVEALVRMSVSHARAGAGFVAPSDMMDGRIAAIREGLEKEGFIKTGIMSYSAKYASCFYGPFRDALDSAPGFGDKKTYQMDYANRTEAIKETLMDVEEGADMVMVKPALAYLDIIREVKNAVNIPVSAYNISGEYAMIKAAAKMGWIDEDKAILEILTAIKRAGADLIATYFARDAVRLIG
jgi:porphobilinogen synthase